MNKITVAATLASLCGIVPGCEPPSMYPLYDIYERKVSELVEDFHAICAVAIGKGYAAELDPSLLHFGSSSVKLRLYDDPNVSENAVAYSYKDKDKNYFCQCHNSPGADIVNDPVVKACGFEYHDGDETNIVGEIAMSFSDSVQNVLPHKTDIYHRTIDASAGELETETLLSAHTCPMYLLSTSTSTKSSEIPLASLDACKQVLESAGVQDALVDIHNVSFTK